jgi:antitoxin component YwqK of YwqJK toxin-antitoxin module
MALTALVLVTVRWWPHTTDADTDGSVAWYRSTVLGKRTYEKVVNSTEGFTIELGTVPGYSHLVSYYKDGSLREESEVYVSYRTNGVHVERERVINGKYYAPDGSIIGQVKDGAGTIVWTRPNGLQFREITLVGGKKSRLRQWFANGQLWVEQSYGDGDLEGESHEYYPNGILRSLSVSGRGKPLSVQHFDSNGNPAPKPDPSERDKFW